MASNPIDNDFLDDEEADGGIDEPGGSTPASGGSPASGSNGGGNTTGKSFAAMVASAIGTNRVQSPDDDGYDNVRSLMRNLNEECAGMSLTLYRDGVVDQVMSTLIGMRKPNPLLVGAPGVGKTRIVEEVARLIATGDPRVPEPLRDVTVWELPVASMVAGMGVVGQLEKRMQEVVAFFEDPDNKAVCFIDEIHQLSDGNQTHQSIAQIIKPALARGRMRVIGATTTAEVRDLRRDPAFARRFERVIVDELSFDQAVGVLRSQSHATELHYGNQVRLDDDTLKLICRVADRFSTPGSHRPDSALTLMDRVCSTEVMAKYRAMASARTDAERERLSKSRIDITRGRLERVSMHMMTGHATKPRADAEDMADALSEIIGEDTQKAAVVASVSDYMSPLFPRTRPMAVLLAGPSGCGKTLTARLLAKCLYDSEPIEVNMCEYTEPSSVTRITGASQGYVGYDSHEEMVFDDLETNPYQVILLDEFEKGCPTVQRLFMSVFDDGVLRTAKGVELDFSKAIIIVTTNAGQDSPRQPMGFAQTETKAARLRSRLAGVFDTELLNRFQLLCEFDPISRESYRDIVVARYNRERDRIAAMGMADGLPEELPEEDADRIVDETYDPRYNARPAERAVRSYIIARA